MNLPRFTQTNLVNSLYVLLWSAGSAVIGATIVWLGNLDVTEQWLFIVPMINTALYALKEWFDRSR